jgi:hypothetical protein
VNAKRPDNDDGNNKNQNVTYQKKNLKNAMQEASHNILKSILLFAKGFTHY